MGERLHTVGVRQLEGVRTPVPLPDLSEPLSLIWNPEEVMQVCLVGEWEGQERLCVKVFSTVPGMW